VSIACPYSNIGGVLVAHGHALKEARVKTLVIDVKTYVVDVNTDVINVKTSHRPEEGAHNPSWPNEHTIIISIHYVCSTFRGASH
jgi:hypothetical protein